jgi:hypothetical protein
VPAVWRAFAEVIPHLTIGDRPDGGLGALRDAEAEALPVRTHVSRAWLMTGRPAPDSWQLRDASRSGHDSPQQDPDVGGVVQMASPARVSFVCILVIVCIYVNDG